MSENPIHRGRETIARNPYGGNPRAEFLSPWNKAVPRHGENRGVDGRWFSLPRRAYCDLSPDCRRVPLQLRKSVEFATVAAVVFNLVVDLALP
jgi:hypothetical protein